MTRPEGSPQHNVPISPDGVIYKKHASALKDVFIEEADELA